MPIPSRMRLPLILLIALSLAGCKSNPVTERIITQGEALEQLQACAITTGELSIHSMQALRILELDETWPTDQEKVKEALEAYDGPDLPLWLRTMALAEVCYLLADETGGGQESLELYVQATLAAMQAVADPTEEASLFDPRHRLLAEIYNRALAQAIELGQQLHGPIKGWNTIRTPMGLLELVVDRGPGLYDPAYFDYLIPTEGRAQTGLANEYDRFGVGASMIGVRNNLDARRERIEAYRGARIIRPVTVMLHPPHQGKMRIGYYDPMTVKSIVSETGRTLTLAGDITAPFAHMIAISNVFEKENPSFFNPEEIEPFTGIYTLQEYDPNKIPVVFVHGLWSSPLTWVWAVNDYLGDEKLRDRYQAWVYAYPTGLPIPYNAAIFRRNLRGAREFFDPDGNDPAMQNMVLVGHSMGGLLSDFMIKDMGDTLWNARLTRPPSEVQGDPEDVQLLEDCLLHVREPYIKRVIFVCAPHRGSTLADGLIGAIGSGLITTPKHLEDLAGRLMAANPGIVKQDPNAPQGLMNSVDGLSANSPILLTMDSVPYPSDLPYHSIMGDEDQAGRKGGTDGIVPYSSSHLDGARSELIVHSGHSATGKQATMNEIRRILRLHLKESSPQP